MPGGRRFTATLLLGGLTAGGLLTACTDDSGPPADPISSAPAVVPSSLQSTVRPPTAPRPARTPAGAEAFVRYFWASYNHAFVTLDPAVVSRLSEPGCDYCTAVVERLQRFRESQIRVEGTRVRVRFVAAPPLRKPKEIVVVTVIEQDEGTFIRPDGVQEHSPRVGRGKSLVGLRWKDGSWRVYDISIESKRDPS